MRSPFWGDITIRSPYPYIQKSISYGDEEVQKIYFTLPEGKKDFPLVIWLHGGGLSGGNRCFPLDLWNGVYGSAEIRYRVSDGKNCTALDALADTVSAVVCILKNRKELLFDPAKVFIGGISAGAYLAAMTAMNPAFLGEYGYSHTLFAGILLVSGQMTTHFQLKKDLRYPGEKYQPVIDQYAPMYYASKEISPVIFITGESGLDLPGRPEENAFMAASLRALGHKHVEYYTLPGHKHSVTFESCDYLLLQFMNKICDDKK